MRFPQAKALLASMRPRYPLELHTNVNALALLAKFDKIKSCLLGMVMRNHRVEEAFDEAGVRIASASCGLRYKGRKDVFLAALVKAARARTSSHARRVRTPSPLPNKSTAIRSWSSPSRRLQRSQRSRSAFSILPAVRERMRAGEPEVIVRTPEGPTHRFECLRIPLGWTFV